MGEVTWEKAEQGWNAENPIPEPRATCCQCGCSDAPKATPAPSTPVWNVHLKDGRVVKVKADIYVVRDGRVMFLDLSDDEFEIANLDLGNIDFIARDGSVEIVPAITKEEKAMRETFELEPPPTPKNVLCRFEIRAAPDEDHSQHVTLDYQSLDWPSGGLLMHVSLERAIHDMVDKAQKVAGRY